MRKILNFVLGLVAIGACFQAWEVVYVDSVEKSTAAPKERSKECLAVEVLPVRTQSVSDEVDLVGSLQALTEINVRARTSGYITSLPFDLGDRVKQGETVVTLDDAAQQETIERSRAALRVAEAERDAEAATLAQAQRTLERYETLSRTRAATEQQLEDARAAVQTAEARVALQDAMVKQAQADLSRAQVDLADLTIVSPIDGVVAERLVNVGDLAQPNESLLRVVSLDTIRTEVYVTERDYDRLAAGQEAVLTVDAFPGRVFHGSVARVAPVVDPITRTALARMEFPNAERLLKPGMHARVTVLFDKSRSADVVPLAALTQAEGESAVFVVAGNPPTISRREVRTGMIDGQVVEILAGVKPGEKVVTLGSRLVKHGQLVAPVETTWPETLVAEAQPGAADAAAAE